jgi:hypothetical protein
MAPRPRRGEPRALGVEAGPGGRSPRPSCPGQVRPLPPPMRAPGPLANRSCRLRSGRHLPCVSHTVSAYVSAFEAQPAASCEEPTPRAATWPCARARGRTTRVDHGQGSAASVGSFVPSGGYARALGVAYRSRNPFTGCPLRAPLPRWTDACKNVERASARDSTGEFTGLVGASQAEAHGRGPPSLAGRRPQGWRQGGLRGDADRAGTG